MEDVLSLYEKPYDSKEPILCFDEKSKELWDDARTPILAKEGVLRTHSEKSLVTTFGEEDAEKIMCRIVFHHTPKHASWLNAAEIELSVMNGQCTKGRIKDASLLKKKRVAWQKRRNADGAVIRWNFTVADAKRKFRLGTDLG